VAELIVALDHDDAASAFSLLDVLPDRCAVKVGSVLFTQAGPGFVRSLVDMGHPVFLDLKWHDIPNTVRGAVARARDLGVDMVTVHASGGSAMIRAAVDAAAGLVRVVAVTVLTSHDADSYRTVIGVPDASIAVDVVRLARLAVEAGADGVVCSPAEVARVRDTVGTRRIVVPGVRRASDALGDQRRVALPEAAVASGATHLVVGRPIAAAADPTAAYAEFVAAARG
jgi:orotidine-5'-phosphate decarboxylase